MSNHDDDLRREVSEIHKMLWVSSGEGRRGLIPIVDSIDENMSRIEKRLDTIFRFLAAVFTPIIVAFLLTLVYMVAQQMGRNLPPSPAVPSLDHPTELEERPPLPAWQPVPGAIDG
jgi:hypothetical protein